MKLNLKLHETEELLTDLSLDETEKRLRATLGAQFLGKEELPRLIGQGITLTAASFDDLKEADAAAAAA